MGMQPVGKPSNLQRRKTRWYYRVRVPKDLCERFTFREKWISLRTGDYAEALKRFDIVSAEWRQSFADARLNPVLPKVSNTSPPVGEDEAKLLARRWFAKELVRREPQHLMAPDLTPAEQDHVEAEIDMEMNDLQQRSLPETAHRSRQIAKAMLEGSGKEVSPSLLNYARRAELQLIAIERARFNGSYANEISDHIFRTENGSPAFAEGAASRTGPTIGEAVSRFLDEEIDILKPSEKTARKYRSVLDQITRHFGADHPISELNRTECRAFRDIVARLPSNFTKRFGPSKSLREIAAQTDEADPRLMAYNTQLTYVQLLCRFSAWCSAEGFLTADPAKGLRPRAKRRPRNELRDPFGLPELRRIFNAPLYVGSVDDQRRLSIPGPNVIRRSRFWLPLISLFSGMREGEILNLQVHDILRSPKGTPYFALFRMGELKTPQSSRQIPVHRELQKIGFLDFVEKCRNSNKTHIFDDVPPGSDGYRSSIFTKRFRTFADSLKLKNANQMTCFHSFRHNFADAVNASGAPEEDREALGGWSRARKSSRSYGFGFDADRLALTMNAVIYEGLDLSHLYKQTP